MSCVFCDIVAGALPAERVLEDEAVVAFLDKKPLFVGHTLVVPRRHAVTLGDLAVEETGLLFARVRRLSVAIPTALGAQGSFVAVNNVVSQSVPHLHVHVVPRSRGDGLRGFFWPRRAYESDEARRRVGEAIRAELSR